MFNVVLVAPEIPPNTGNVIRLCANTGSSLHLVHPLGFELTDKHLRRAGLDYHEWVHIQVYDTFADYVDKFGAERCYLFSKFHANLYTDAAYESGDSLVFGSETSGLPDSIRALVNSERHLTLPMVSGSRSLNLSNAVAVAVFEAWRQTRFSSGSG